MTETILAQRFKAIRNEAATAIPIQPLTILMGEHATGKSTLAKLVYFFKTLASEILQAAQQRHALGITAAVASRVAANYFHTLFGHPATLSRDFFLQYQYPNGN